MRTWEGNAYVGGSYNYQQQPQAVPLVNHGKLLAENGKTLTLFVNDFEQHGVLRSEADSQLIINQSSTVPEEAIVNRGRIETSHGDVHINGDLALSNVSTLSIELSLDLVAGAEPVTVAGSAELSGFLEILMPDDTWMPTAGDSFAIFAATGGVSGEFTNHSLPQLAAGLYWQLDIEPNTVTLEVLDSAPPGDFNFDGVVNAADYPVWLKFDGSPPSYDVWQTNYGPTTNHGASFTPAVPEPTSSVLLFLAAGVLCFRARRTMTNRLSSATDFEVIVIGAGAAGLLAAIRSAERGRRTLLLGEESQAGRQNIDVRRHALQHYA